jgi:dTDP-4-dehydrorhamnose 3,5-epimerase
MPFSFSRLEIPEVILIEPLVFRDQRGFFMETYKHSEFTQEGIPGTFVQGSHSKSARGVLRGLHYQKNPKAQGKLIRALSGEIYDVAVDLRRGGPTYGHWVAVTLSAGDKKMLYVPQGFAHGFCVTSEESEVLYLATEEYAPECEAGVLWNDPQLGIAWPVEKPRLSARDRAWPLLRDADSHFSYAVGGAKDA